VTAQTPVIRISQRSRRFAVASLIAVVSMMATACGGGGSSGGSGETTGGSSSAADLQPYTLRWQQPAAASITNYRLSVGSRSGQYESQVNFSSTQVAVAADGSLSHSITLDRSRDQYLVMIAMNSTGSSPSSNELRIPALGAPGAAAITSTSQTARPGPSVSPSMAVVSSAALVGGIAPASSALASDNAPSAAVSRDTAVMGDEPLRSLDFNGIDQSLESLSAVARGASASFSIWAKMRDAATGRRGLAELTCPTRGCGLELEVDTGVSSQLELWGTGATGDRVLIAKVPVAASAGDWWHVGLVIDFAAGRASVFLDGTAVLVASSSAIGGDFLQEDGLLVTLGATGGSEVATWNGRLGHAAIFERSLSADEIEAIALGGHDLDLRTFGIGRSPAHYWRLGADPSNVGRDSADHPIDLEAQTGEVHSAHIAIDAPRGRSAEDDPTAQ
jgi:hypothetical protein